MISQRGIRQDEPTFPSVRALAKELNIGYQTCYAGLRDKTIPGIRIGKRWILPRAAIAKWLEQAGNQGAV